MFKRFLKYLRRLLLLAVIVVMALLSSAPFYIYERFNQETPVARLSFIKTADLNYIVQLQQGDFCNSKQFTLLGDQFQLDAGFVKWKGLGVLLGFEPRYRLDRLSGRYSDLNAQNSLESISHNLAPDVLFDFFDETASEGKQSWLIDTRYGSSVYLTIDPLLQYQIFATEDGMIARSEPILNYDRQNGELKIEISQGCAGTTSGLEKLSRALNTLAENAL